MTRTLLALLAVLLLAPVATASAADPPSPLGIPSANCTTQGDGAVFCDSKGPTVKASDGQTILDVNVTVPATTQVAGGYPLVIVAHGYGGAKKDFTTREANWIPSAKEWAEKGYAVLNVTDRGFQGSCGSQVIRAMNLANCMDAHVKLDDARYEIRDVQALAGTLADQGWIDGQKIGAVGESYGGGLSLMLATLRNRVMQNDGTLAPWKSDGGKPMSLAAAVPTIPWSSLVSSLVPNGQGLDYEVTKAGTLSNPVGVEKQSFVAGLYFTGMAPTTGTYARPGQDPDSDLNAFYARINRGEPYETSVGPEPTINFILDSFVKYRNPYELLNGEATPAGAAQAPAPVLISNGFTDDLFPVDEAVRYYNLVRAKFPSTPISMVHMDYGHMRGQNKDADTDYLRARTTDWIDFHVRGQGADPGTPVTALTQTCPKEAASGGPFVAGTWAGLSPGEIRYASAAGQTVLSTGGNPNNAKTFDPVAGGGACATVADDNEPGSALYTLPAATGDGYTLLGSPTIAAKLAITGTFPELTGRLLDVAPDGKRTLVARTIYRPKAAGGGVVFQLHPGAWKFAAGHKPELELLGSEAPYARKSNGTFSIGVSDLTLVLPTRETQGNGAQPATPPPAPPATNPTPKPKPKPTGKARPGFTGPRIVTLQHRGRGSVFTSVRGTLARTRGRPCRPGKVRVAIQVNKKILVQHLPSMGRGCSFSTTLSYRVSRLGKAYHSRAKRLRETVVLRYGGNRQLAAATRSRTAKVNRTPRR